MADDPHRTEPFPSDADVRAVLLEFKGDAHEAIRALLHDLNALARDYERDVSKGFVRVGSSQNSSAKISRADRRSL